MKLALTTGLVRAAEEATVAAGGMLADLMDRAGTAVAVEVSALAPSGRVVVVTGSGNNGGDGWVAARRLRESGREVSVLALRGPDGLAGITADAARAAVVAGVPWSEVRSGDETVLTLDGASCVVDAVLGVGLRGAPREPARSVLDAIDDANAVIVAVDVPSGVDGDTGLAPGAVVRADATVSMGWAKAGLVLQPGASFAGEMIVADIGLAEPVDLAGALEVWDWDDLAALVPVPSLQASKYSRGRVLVIGGSPGMTGAVVLAAQGALRMGGGHVTVAVPAPSLTTAECTLLAPVKAPLPIESDGGLGPGALARLLELAARADAVVIGPGLGRADSTVQTVRSFLAQVAVPVVVDADALYAARVRDLAERRAPTLVTPHAGEAARMLGSTSGAIDADRPSAARSLSGGTVVCLLKGPRTLVSDGERVVVTMTGGPSLATLGTGDVLAGMAGALLAQGLDPLEAGTLAAHLHGAAGDEAARWLTPVCCTAPDVLTYLPEAVRALLG